MTEQKQVIPEGYKLTEIGVLPSEWDVFNGRELFTKIQDGTHFSPKITGGNFLYITSKNIKNGYFYLNNAEYIDELQHEAIYRRCDVRLNDILLTKDGVNTGNAALNCLSEPFSLLSSVAFLRLDLKKHIPEFFLQQILSDPFQRKIQEEMSGNAITRLTLQKINNLKFFVPSLKEQTAIANALSDVDALISELEKLIAKKQAIKTATMQQLLTGKTRLPEFALREDGTPKGYKASELGEIPEDWEVYCLDEIIQKTQLGGNYQNSEQESDYPLIKMGNLDRGVIKLDKIEFVTKKPSKNDKLYYGDVLFNTRNTLELVGKVAIWRNELPQAYFNSNLMRFIFNDELVSNNFYINAVMNSKKFITALSGIATGTTSVAAIYARDLLNLKIFLPSKKEQVAIASILFDIDEEIQTLQQRLNKTRQIKQGMMQALLTGKTRLI